MADIDIFQMTKQSAERRTRTIDFSAKVPASVTITGSAVACVEALGLTDKSSMLADTTGTRSGDTISFTVLGGEHGKDYRITVTATLSNSDILTADLMLRVKDF